MRRSASTLLNIWAGLPASDSEILIVSYWRRLYMAMVKCR